VVGVRKDGSEFPLELSLATWKMKEKVFFTAIGRDITEMKQARAREESIRLQQEVIEAQKQVIGELSTPTRYHRRADRGQWRSRLPEQDHPDGAPQGCPDDCHRRLRGGR
jgi:hypothetical protein